MGDDQQNPRLMTKADFARDRGVSRACVSQWISKGTIGPEAIEGDGRKAKIIVAVAIEHVRKNRDIGQSLGNGIETKTSGSASATLNAPAFDLRPAKPPDAPPQETVTSPQIKPVPDSVEDELKRERLRNQRMINRRLAEEEAVRRDLLISSDDAREQMARIAGMMMQIFEGALPEMAAALSEKFEIPARDVLHLMRAEFRKVRATAASKERSRAAETERQMVVPVELEI